VPLHAKPALWRAIVLDACGIAAYLGYPTLDLHTAGGAQSISSGHLVFRRHTCSLVLHTCCQMPSAGTATGSGTGKGDALVVCCCDSTHSPTPGARPWHSQSHTSHLTPHKLLPVTYRTPKASHIQRLAYQSRYSSCMAIATLPAPYCVICASATLHALLPDRTRLVGLAYTFLGLDSSGVPPSPVAVSSNPFWSLDNLSMPC
jgi:hypothetical protein